MKVNIPATVPGNEGTFELTTDDGLTVLFTITLSNSGTVTVTDRDGVVHSFFDPHVKEVVRLLIKAGAAA